MKSYELQCLDYACVKTMEKGDGYNSVSHITNAIKKLLLERHTAGFTNNENARSYIKNLDSDKIEKELILNLVKQKACERSYGITTMFSTKKTFDDQLTSQEAGDLIYEMLNEGEMEAVKWILNKYPKLYYDLSWLFTETRYFNNHYTISRLDNEDIYNDTDKRLFNKVNTYYDQMGYETNGIRR